MCTHIHAYKRGSLPPQHHVLNFFCLEPRRTRPDALCNGAPKFPVYCRVRSRFFFLSRKRLGPSSFFHRLGAKLILSSSGCVSFSYVARAPGTIYCAPRERKLHLRRKPARRGVVFPRRPLSRDECERGTRGLASRLQTVSPPGRVVDVSRDRKFCKVEKCCFKFLHQFFRISVISSNLTFLYFYYSKCFFSCSSFGLF